MPEGGELPGTQTSPRSWGLSSWTGISGEVPEQPGFTQWSTSGRSDDSLG